MDLVAGGASSSDRRQWNRIFGSLAEILQGQQAQTESLLADRGHLQDYIRSQHDRWLSRTRHLECHISSMEKKGEMWKKVQAGKLDSLLGLKERMAMCYMDQYDEVKQELEEFRESIKILNCQITELKKSDNEKASNDASRAVGSSEEVGKSAVILGGEMQKLKHAYEKLVTRKEDEAASLLADKDFIWHQFEKIDNDCKSQCPEVEQANESVEKLQSTIRMLQSSEIKKNETIARLRADVTKLELDLRRCSRECELANEKVLELQVGMEELRKLTNERDVINRKMKNGQADITIDKSRRTNRKSRFSKEKRLSSNAKACSAPPARKILKTTSAKRSAEHLKNEVLKKRLRFCNVSNGPQGSGAPKGIGQCSKAKTAPISSPENPKLFSSKFKVPKLKILSSAQL